jgi:hypothetical protein
MVLALNRAGDEIARFSSKNFDAKMLKDKVLDEAFQVTLPPLERHFQSRL